MAIDDNTSYELTGAQVKDLAAKIKAKADDNIFVGATSAAPGSKGIVPAPQAGDDTKFLSGDGTWQTIGKGVTVFNTEQHLRESQFQHLIYKDYARTIPAYTEDIYNAAVSGGAILFCDDRGADESESFYITAYYDPDDGYYEIYATSGKKVYRLEETTYHSGAYTSYYAGYEDFTGATSQHWGTSGLVPTPHSTDVDKYLKGDGTWATPTDTTYTAGTNVQISAQNVISATDTTYSAFTGATSSVAGSAGLVPAPAAGDEGKALHGDGTWKNTTAKLVEMSYGESSAWAKFIAAYNAGSIVYCRASSNANPGTGSQTRKAFMAYVNNAANPTSVEFQYVRSNSSKSDSNQCDQVFVYTLTNASGGTWSVATRDMAPKINVDSTLNKTFSGGANASVTLGAKAMTGATGSAAGTAGIVPAPATTDNTKFLRGDGTWQTVGSSGTAYSTSEVATNDTWLNGETIYRKTITSSGADGTVAHGITNLDKVIKVEAVLNDNDIMDGLLDAAYVLPSSMYVDGMWEFLVTSTNIVLNFHGTLNTDSPSFHVTLYYTKGTPRPEPEPEEE